MVETYELEDHVRKRPGMYIFDLNDHGKCYVLVEVLKDFLTYYRNSPLIIKIIMEQNICSISIEGDINFSDAWEKITNFQPGPKLLFFYTRVATALCSEFTMTHNGKAFTFLNGKPQGERTVPDSGLPTIILALELDKVIFKNVSINYELLRKKIYNLALVNCATKFLITDTTPEYNNQHFTYCPDGVSNLFHKVILEISRHYYEPKRFQISIDRELNGNKYQIALAYHQDMYNKSFISSYADDYPTIEGGSLVDGVIQGIRTALKVYKSISPDEKFIYSKVRLLKNLVLCCAVRFGNPDALAWAGSTRNRLQVPFVIRDAQKITCEALLQHFKTNPEDAALLISNCAVRDEVN